MKGLRGKPLPEFGPSSPELREAVRMIHRARLANALAFQKGVKPNPPSPELEAAMKLVADTTNKRFAALYEHFSVERDLPKSGGALAYLLACELIPGFDTYYIPPLGRPKSVLKDHALLAQAVHEAMSRNSRLSIKAACSKLARTDDRFKGKTPSELEAAFHRFTAEEAKRELIDDYQRSER
jgi:hypothetical protein